MNKYKVVQEFTAPANGDVPETKFAVGEEVEMEADHAAPLVEQGVLELVAA